MKNLLIIALLSVLTACSSQSADSLLPEQPDANAFGGYWHQGKAEITRFALEQARYGEVHQGDAVLIYVTEPFLKAEQVKRDFGDGDANDVLKLNATRKFNTGIYPYSLMTSTFTVVNHDKPTTPKISFSGQEWCGHVFMQLNQTKKGYRGQLNSYFQQEGDKELKLPDAPTEDGLWTQLRMAPRSLPVGKIKMIPALHFLRLAHVEAKAYKAKATLEPDEDNTFGENLLRYTLTYTDLDRSLDIYFETQEPHRIMGWQERDKTLVTKATRTHEMMTDYWSKNGLEHAPLRQQLGL